MTSLLAGRGLWYGARTFTLHEWDLACQQAHRWGIQVVHPKLGDAENPNILWYDGPTLEKLRSIAVDTYHLQVSPYLWCYGGQFLAAEARAARLLGNTFGSVILDIEDAWSGHTDWAIAFGQHLRDLGYTHPVYATVYANPEQHPTPNEALNTWVTGFLPQVYFSVWYPKTAAHAIAYFQPEWKRIEADLKAKRQVLRPILPIISLGNGLPLEEVTHWLHEMHAYGYCGFWYDGEYAPYADTILQAPIPAFTGLSSIPSSLSPTLQGGKSMATAYDQNLSPVQLQALWHMHNSQVVWNPKSAICQLWTNLMQHHLDIPIGFPTDNETTGTIDGQKATYIIFTSGRWIVYFWQGGTVCLC